MRGIQAIIIGIVLLLIIILVYVEYVLWRRYQETAPTPSPSPSPSLSPILSILQ